MPERSDRFKPGAARTCIRLGDGAEVLIGNDHEAGITIIVGVGRAEGVAQLFNISTFVMDNIIDQFEAPPC